MNNFKIENIKVQSALMGDNIKYYVISFTIDNYKFQLHMGDKIDKQFHAFQVIHGLQIELNNPDYLSGKITEPECPMCKSIGMVECSVLHPLRKEIAAYITKRSEQRFIFLNSNIRRG